MKMKKKTTNFESHEAMGLVYSRLACVTSLYTCMFDAVREMGDVDVKEASNSFSNKGKLAQSYECRKIKARLMH